MAGSLAVVQIAARMSVERLGAWSLARLGDPLARLTQPQGQRDPYPEYERIRERGPLSRSRTGLWVTCSHALAVQLVRDRRFRVRTSADRVGSGLGELEPGLDDSLVDLEPPEHTRIRRLVAPAFGRSRIQAYRSRIEKVVDELLDQAASGRSFDLVADFAGPLPIAIITDLLGVAGSDATRFAHYGRVIAGLLDGVRSVRQAREIRQVVQDLHELFVDLARVRAADPGEDVISTLVTMEDDDRLTEDEIATLSTQLLIAGFETTTSLIGNGVAAMLNDREQWQGLCDDPGLAAAVVEETLRYDPPVQLTQRIACEPLELAGHRLAVGDQVIVGLAGANRDPAVFADPARFDVLRGDGAEHIGFSGGHHYCVGAPLARLEGEIAFRALARRFPRLRLAGPLTHRRSTVLRGLVRFPVTPIAPAAR